MRLLILTQTVDRKDSSLGYYHSWLRELSRHFDHLTVLALCIGDYDLPQNVTVIPLRPWGYRAWLRTAWRVIKLAWEHRKEYEAVFVHMNQEYLIVAGWLWRLFGKRIYFWRNHYEGSVVTDVAATLCDKIFYTSRFSYTAKYRNARQMPVGVDVDSCHLDEPIERKPHSILFLGRFDTSKHPDLVVEALGKLSQSPVPFTATFVGGPSDPHSMLPKKVGMRAQELGIADRVTLTGPVAHTDTYRYYRSHSIYVNCGKSGMLDKSLFKSIACGCLPVFTSADLVDIVGSEFAFADGDADDLAEHLKAALALPEEVRKDRVREFEEKAVMAHTLPVLARRLAEEMTV